MLPCMQRIIDAQPVDWRASLLWTHPSRSFTASYRLRSSPASAQHASRHAITVPRSANAQMHVDAAACRFRTRQQARVYACVATAAKGHTACVRMHVESRCEFARS